MMCDQKQVLRRPKCTQIQTVFIDEENKSEHVEAVLTWLSTDFYERAEPSNHFWHNREIIAEAFDNCKAMVALNRQNEVVGYLIWSRCNIRVEIVIVEVKENYRRQGIFKKMTTDLTNRFTDVFVLSASVLPQSETAFNNAGWEKISVCGFGSLRTKHFKIIRPVLESLERLPNGRAIAVFSRADVPSSGEHIDFYVVKDNPDKYKCQMKHFQIDLDDDGKLRVPLVTSYHYEDYIGIYFNRELLAEGKAKHLFAYDSCDAGGFLLCMNRIESQTPELFKGFFPELQQQEAKEEISVSAAMLTPAFKDEKRRHRKKRKMSSLPAGSEFTEQGSTEEKPTVEKLKRYKRSN